MEEIFTFIILMINILSHYYTDDHFSIELYNALHYNTHRKAPKTSICLLFSFPTKKKLKKIKWPKKNSSHEEGHLMINKPQNKIKF